MIRVALCAALLTTAPEIVRAATPSDLPKELETAWNSHDVDKFMALFTPDAKWTLMTVPPTIAPVRQQAEDFIKGYPDTTCNLGSHAANEHQVMIEWSCTGTEAGTKKRVDVHIAEVDVIGPDGKIKARRSYVDPATFK